MKKWVVGLGAALVLMGCNGAATEEAEDTLNDTPDTGENQNSDGETTEDTDNTNDTETDLDEVTDTDTDVNESETMTFVPQLADTEAGLTTENDEVLSVLNELVQTSDVDDVGLPNDITIQFTGLYLEDSDQELLLPIFLISNRTEEAYTNIEMAITFGTADGELLFEETSFMLRDNEFGVLEPDTAMPVYLNADYSHLDLVERISQSRDEAISIDTFDGETLGSQ